MNLLEATHCVHQAAEDVKVMSTDRQWARLEVNWTDTVQPRICIHYGTIHTNGMREQAIATRHYYYQNGKVQHYIQGHP